MQIHNEKMGRATYDLDIAIAIPNWDEYEKIEKGILTIDGFTKDPTQKQRFFFLDLFQLDIVPFGDVMKQNDKIFWPPDESIAMSVLGFSDVSKAVNEIVIDESLKINITSLEGLFLLKLVAWTDRNYISNKDADDMAFILNNYLSINEDKAIKNHFDLYQNDDFDIKEAGARLLGRDMSHLLLKNKAAQDKVIKILDDQIILEEQSLLINQILETHKAFKYEEALNCLKNIVAGLKDNQ